MSCIIQVFASVFMSDDDSDFAIMLLLLAAMDGYFDIPAER
jgi:hypothetical protein